MQTVQRPTCSDLAGTPSGVRTHADGQYVARDAPEHSWRDREVLAGSNWCGRGGLLGGYRDWITALWKSGPGRRPYSGLPGSWSDRLDRATPSPACNGSDRMGGSPCPDRVLLCRAVHCCRELAQQRSDGGNPGADPERLRHDGAVGRDRRTAPSPGDRSGRIQTVLRRRDYSRVRPGADRSDSGRGSDPGGRGRPDQPETAVSAVALRTGGGLVVRGDHKCILRLRPDLCATAGPRIPAELPS